MIDTHFIHNLPEDEQLLFYAAADHVFKTMGIAGQLRYYQMIKPKVLADWIDKIANLHDAYEPIKQSLTEKLRNYTY